ncbi:MAG TPA: hypothetical protein VF103_06680 [Polyangiaceae bacterium]
MNKSAALALTLLVSGGTLVFGCSSDDEGGDGAGGESGSSGTAGAESGGTNASGGSAGATAGGASGSGSVQGGASGAAGEGAGGADCSGDPERWAEITSGPIACSRNSDCCVVVNQCKAAAQIVHADDYPGARALWPSCDDECYDCFPPVVYVACVDGFCTGEEDDEALDEGMSHCGSDDEIVAAPSSSMAFGCGI